MLTPEFCLLSHYNVRLPLAALAGTIPVGIPAPPRGLGPQPLGGTSVQPQGLGVRFLRRFSTMDSPLLF